MLRKTLSLACVSPPSPPALCCDPSTAVPRCGSQDPARAALHGHTQVEPTREPIPGQTSAGRRPPIPSLWAESRGEKFPRLQKLWDPSRDDGSGESRAAHAPSNEAGIGTLIIPAAPSGSRSGPSVPLQRRPGSLVPVLPRAVGPHFTFLWLLHRSLEALPSQTSPRVPAPCRYSRFPNAEPLPGRRAGSSQGQ